MSYILLIFLIWNYSFTSGLIIKSHFSGTNSSNFPRLQMIGSFPLLHEFTICSWIKFYSNGNSYDLTLLSYTPPHSSDQMRISIIDLDPGWNIHFNIGEASEKFDFDEFRSGKWYHLCVTWYSNTDKVKFYQNGKICKQVTDKLWFKKIPVIPPGGILIIGQTHNGTNGKYDEELAWYGDIADVQIWNEVLNIDQIQEAGKCNGNRKAGNIFSWMKTEMLAIDNVIFSETELCYP